MTKETYNGWTGINSNGYETWLVNIHFGDDALVMAQEHYNETGEKWTRDDYKDYVEQFIDEIDPATNGFMADMMNAALASVNWYELAEALEYDEDERDDHREDDVDELKDQFRLECDKGDPWGSVMGALFACCATLSRRGYPVPEALQYSDGAGGPPPADEDAMELEPYASATIAEFAVSYLDRARAILERRGLAY